MPTALAAAQRGQDEALLHPLQIIAARQYSHPQANSPLTPQALSKWLADKAQLPLAHIDPLKIEVGKLKDPDAQNQHVVNIVDMLLQYYGRGNPRSGNCRDGGAEALTGYLVLSTLHINDAPIAIRHSPFAGSGTARPFAQGHPQWRDGPAIAANPMYQLSAGSEPGCGRLPGISAAHGSVNTRGYLPAGGLYRMSQHRLFRSAGCLWNNAHQ
jgi:hypothetical protein